MTISPLDENEVRIEAHVDRALWLWDEGHYRLAFRMLLTDAKRGNATAQSSLGYFYDYGLGNPRSRRKAIFWYTCAYRQGSSIGANNLGTIYRDIGDFQRALIWFERAIKLGDISPHFEIAKMYYRRKKNIPKTIEHMALVANAKPGTEVSEWDNKVATRFLRLLERGKSSS
jgi:TPR repeat protein